MTAAEIQDEITEVEAPRVVANHSRQTAYVVGHNADKFPDEIVGYRIVDDPN